MELKEQRDLVEKLIASTVEAVGRLTSATYTPEINRELLMLARDGLRWPAHIARGDRNGTTDDATPEELDGDAVAERPRRDRSQARGAVAHGDRLRRAGGEAPAAVALVACGMVSAGQAASATSSRSATCSAPRATRSRSTSTRGQWSDFATGERRRRPHQPVRRARGAHAGRRRAKLDWRQRRSIAIARAASASRPSPRRGSPIMPVPGDAGAERMTIGARDRRTRRATSGSSCKFIARWAYLDSEGRTARLRRALRVATRARSSARTSSRRPTARTRGGQAQWRWKSFPEPRPLYGLDQLAARPDAPVMVVEGEKKVEALKSIAPQYVGVAWPGGAAAWQKADWTPDQGSRRHVLAGRRQAGHHGAAGGAVQARDRRSHPARPSAGHARYVGDRASAYSSSARP
jgi:hypothetical protein